MALTIGQKRKILIDQALAQLHTVEAPQVAIRVIGTDEQLAAIDFDDGNMLTDVTVEVTVGAQTWVMRREPGRWPIELEGGAT